MGQSFRQAITDFEPQTVLAAKRANEQVKLSANLMNAVAGAAVSIFALSELLKPTPAYLGIVVAVGLALYVHATARSLLGLLKDEQPTSTLAIS